MSNPTVRICRTCGKEFFGGSRMRYCQICREERQKQQMAAHKARRRAGKSRVLGGKDTCVRCGAEYVILGSNQRYCPACTTCRLRQR